MSIRYTSTRDRGVKVTFSAAVSSSQPGDGGLFIPDSIPEVDPGSWSANDAVPDIARSFFPAWMGEGVETSIDLGDVFHFPVPIVHLDGASGQYAGISVVELFHGPTGSFKDFGARFLAAFVASARKAVQRPAIVVVATSGDTGSAVAEAFSGMPNVGVVVLYPRERVSKVQEAQLTRPRDGVWAFAVEGSFDDCQGAAKRVLARGSRFADLLSANSINIGRLIPQMLFYMKGVSAAADPTTFVVPCGNLGNLTAGLLARASALPHARFVAATNANDYFARLLVDCESSPRALATTLSNAMDVVQPSNLERIDSLFPPDELATFLSADSVDDAHTMSTMRRAYEATGYVADPHTAVALTSALRLRSEAGPSGAGPIAVIATADPAKYAELVRRVIGKEIEFDRFADSPSPPSGVIAPGQIPEEVDRVAQSLD